MASVAMNAPSVHAESREMEQTKDSTASTKDHLARIRENQRRSRARKREYVSDLETKIKSCQEEGLQLNVQIQRTARRIVEENKKLRELLSRVGVDEWAVEQYLKSNSGAEFQSYLSRRQQDEEILKAKHPCFTCGSAPGKSSKEKTGCGSKKSSCADQNAAVISPEEIDVSVLGLEDATTITASARVQGNMASTGQVQYPVHMQYSQVTMAPLVQSSLSLVQPSVAPTTSSVVPSMIPSAIQPIIPAGIIGGPQLPASGFPISSIQSLPEMTSMSSGLRPTDNILPVDFTAYFQSEDLDSIAIPEQIFQVQHYSTESSTSSSEGSNSCCASSASAASSPEDKISMPGENC
ncbi:uncharacterized protein V1516DRAFT_668236 [Lipomyces oligophaga]|uniref:uncharacterized protein n=1 Tax=Lipomyces oligophaga TaxID=45792 RepID=UPI0034CF6E54